MDFFSIYSLSSFDDDEQNTKLDYLAKVIELLCEDLGIEVNVETLEEAGWFKDAKTKITLKHKKHSQ